MTPSAILYFQGDFCSLLIFFTLIPILPLYTPLQLYTKVIRAQMGRAQKYYEI